MRVSPRPRTAVLVFLGYLLVFYSVWAMTGVDYTRAADSADTVLKWFLSAHSKRLQFGTSGSGA